MQQRRGFNIHFRNTATPSPIGLKKEVIASHPNVVEAEAAAKAAGKVWKNPIAHSVWSEAELDNIKLSHRPPQDAVDYFALAGVKMLRLGFDIVSGYKWGSIDENKLLRRILFLETAAGIPGMVAGSLRHLKSLRRMSRDHGWIHTLTEEAENERMHMLCFMDLYQPGVVFRAAVLVTQGVFWNTFFCMYLLSPRLCHRFVGYLEEEAVRTYTDALAKMDDGTKYPGLHAFSKKPANEISKQYWRLPDDATMRLVVRHVRADEANHRDVNHVFASIGPDETNPFLAHEAQRSSHRFDDPPSSQKTPPKEG